MSYKVNQEQGYHDGTRDRQEPTDYSPDRDLQDLDTSTYRIVTYTKPAEALGVIANLLHFDHRYAKLTLAHVMNEVTGVVAGNNYVIVVRKIGDREQPIAVFGWNFLDEYTLVIRANNIRPLAPVEVTRGNIPTIAMFSSPFSSPHQMMQFITKNSSKLQDIGEIVGIDNFVAPSDNY